MNLLSLLQPYCYWDMFQRDLSVNPSKKIRQEQGFDKNARVKKLQVVIAFSSLSNVP